MILSIHFLKFSQAMYSRKETITKVAIYAFSIPTFLKNNLYYRHDHLQLLMLIGPNFPIGTTIHTHK
jgi:hypothetical protein